MHINKRTSVDWHKQRVARKLAIAKKQLERYTLATESLIRGEEILNKLGYKPGVKILHKQFKLCEIDSISISDTKGTVTMWIKEVKPDPKGYSSWHKVNLSRVSELTEAAKIIYE